MSTQSSPERVLDHSLDEEIEEVTDVAMLDEEQEGILQLNQIRWMTVRPGLMKLPVKQVSMVPDNPNVVIDVEHPIEGEVRFHKPKFKSYSKDHELVRFLRWYGYDMDDLYYLQTQTVYVDVTAEKTRDWKLVKPPDFKDPIMYRIKRKLPSADTVVNRKAAFTLYSIAALPTSFALSLWLLSSVSILDMVWLAGSSLGIFIISILAFMAVVSPDG